MAYSVQTLLNDVVTGIHGTTINKVPGIYAMVSRAARTLLLDVDPKETQRIVALPQVFNSVFDYPCPVDVKGDRVIDLRPQAGRKPSDIFPQGYGQDFSANQNVSFDTKSYVQWNTGLKTLRIQAPELPAPLTLCDTSTVTGWTATGGASNLSLDSTNQVAGAGAIVFDLGAGSASGSIQISALSPVDVTGRVNVDSEYFWLYLPTGTAVSSVTLRFGSDISGNYYTYTATTTQQGTTFQSGWNLIAMPWASATKVGAPIVTAYNSVQLTLNYNSTLQTGVKFCSLRSITGSFFEAVYYSKYLFRDPVTNAFQESVVDITDTTKLINLDTESYNLLFNKLATYVAQSLQGADSDYDATFWNNEYGNALERYKAQNPSEAMLKGSQYYSIPRNTSSRFRNRL